MPYTPRSAAPIGGPGAYGQTPVPFTPQNSAQFDPGPFGAYKPLRGRQPPTDEGLPRPNSGVYVDGLGFDGVDLTAPAAKQRDFIDMAMDASSTFEPPGSQRQPTPQSVLSGLRNRRTPPSYIPPPKASGISVPLQ